MDVEQHQVGGESVDLGEGGRAGRGGPDDPEALGALHEAGVDGGDHEVVVDDEHGELSGVIGIRSSVDSGGQTRGEDGAAVIVHRHRPAPALADDLHQGESDAATAGARWAWC